MLRVIREENTICVPKLIDVYEDAMYLSIVMEFKDSPNLLFWLKEKHLLMTEQQVKLIFYQLCISIARLHELGIVHRDLKLENILIDDTVTPPKPFLIDFGLSKVFMTEQYSTDPYGTLAYCSPEIVLRRKHNRTTDVWSMGVILYIMLSHRMPFLSNENDSLTKHNILNKEINL